MTTDPVVTVHAWHEALNAGDVEGLMALSSDDVEVGGPRETGRGAALLREWFGRAGIRLEVYQTFHRDNTVVVEQGANWRGPAASTATERQTVASVFVAKDGRVASVVRHADLASALAASGLAYADKVQADVRGLGGVLTAQGGDHRGGVRLIRAALHRRLGTALQPDEQRECDVSLAAVRATPGGHAFAAAWAEGDALQAEQAVASALAIERLDWPMLD